MNRGLVLALVLLGACGGDDSKEDTPDAAPDAPVDAMIDAPPTLACSDADPAAGLRLVPGVTSVTENPCGDYVAGAATCFEIGFDQPLDHANPTGPHFTQYLYLVHRGCARPTVVADWGYGMPDLGVSWFDEESTFNYSTNNLWIEHRYQGKSHPDPASWDWSQLTIKNGADDMHAVIASFRPLYSAAHWVATGASKGGITATYHHYYYPHDVDGSIPYVAPASRARLDPQYQDRLESKFTSTCANNLRDVQTSSLTTRREAMKAHLTSQGAGFESVYLEYIIESLDWGFWQYGGVEQCDSVPPPTATDDEVWTFLSAQTGLPQSAHLAPPAAHALEDLESGSLEYEWLTEQGFALQIGSHVAPLLQEPDAKVTMEDGFTTQYGDVVTLPAYDGSITATVRTWITSADHMLLIYGDLDPWSGGAMDAPTGVAAGRYFVPNANHGAGIDGLAQPEQDAAIAILNTLMGQEPTPVQFRTARRWQTPTVSGRSLALRAEHRHLQHFLLPR